MSMPKCEREKKKRRRRVNGAETILLLCSLQILNFEVPVSIKCIRVTIRKSLKVWFKLVLACGISFLRSTMTEMFHIFICFNQTMLRSLDTFDTTDVWLTSVNLQWIYPLNSNVLKSVLDENQWKRVCTKSVVYFKAGKQECRFLLRDQGEFH